MVKTYFPSSSSSSSPAAAVASHFFLLVWFLSTSKCICIHMCKWLRTRAGAFVAIHISYAFSLTPLRMWRSTHTQTHSHQYALTWRFVLLHNAFDIRIIWGIYAARCIACRHILLGPSACIWFIVHSSIEAITQELVTSNSVPEMQLKHSNGKYLISLCGDPRSCVVRVWLFLHWLTL